MQYAARRARSVPPSPTVSALPTLPSYVTANQAIRDVLTQLNTIRGLFSSYKRIRSSATSATSPEYQDARNELEANLKDLTFDLEDLIESVKAVESDPYKFGLEIEEVERRRRLVGEVGAEVDGMRAELQKTVNEVQNKSKAPVNNDVLADPDSFEDEEDEYAEFEEQRQVEMMHEQDQALDGVFRTVGNLRQQADDMGRELEDQTEMLKDVDDVADRVGSKLQNGLKKVGWVIKQNEGRLVFELGAR